MFMSKIDRVDKKYINMVDQIICDFLISIIEHI